MEVNLGGFIFSVKKNSAWDKMTRARAWSYIKEDDIRGFERSYFKKRVTPKYTLSGLVDARKYGGRPFKKLEEMADKGLPYILKDEEGYYRGKWIVLSLNEESDLLNENMVPDFLNFRLEIEKYEEHDQKSEA